jgi:predicted thioesterase
MARQAASKPDNFLWEWCGGSEQELENRSLLPRPLAQNAVAFTRHLLCSRELTIEELTMPEVPRPGLVGETRVMVDATNLANSFGANAVDVYAMPALIENAAIKAVEHLLPSGSGTVGTHLDIRHLAATPPGLKVWARAELVEVEGRRLKFKVEAFDPSEKIGEGSHERSIVDLGRLIARAEAKATGLARSSARPSTVSAGLQPTGAAQQQSTPHRRDPVECFLVRCVPGAR